MPKRSIPSVPKDSIGDRQQFDTAVKENLEIILGQRNSRVDGLSPGSSTDQIIVKINELIKLLQ